MTSASPRKVTGEEIIEADAACLRRAVEDFVLAFERASFPGAALIVKDLRDALDDYHALDNLQYLCRSCHTGIHAN